MDFCGLLWTLHDAHVSSLMDSTMSPKVKTTKGEGVVGRSLVRNILKVEGVLELWDGD
jgi:hypothetical protein